MSHRSVLVRTAAAVSLALTAGLLPTGSPSAAAAPPPGPVALKAPFDCGQTWKVSSRSRPGAHPTGNELDFNKGGGNDDLG